MEVSGQPQALPALPPEKELPQSIEEEAGWAPAPMWTVGRKENYGMIHLTLRLLMSYIYIYIYIYMPLVA